jgi:ACT domain-containing protein
MTRFPVSKKIVSESDIESLAKNGVVEVVRGMIVTPLAREFASRRGIRLVYAGGSVPSSEDLPRDPETGRKGAESEEALRRAVTDQVVRAMAEMSSGAGRFIPAHSPLASPGAAMRIAEARAGEPQRAVVVATGRNQPGIAAALTNAISACGADIQDLSQTIVSDFFSMIFVLNIDSMSGGLTFKGFKEKLEAAGKAVGAEVVCIHEAILQAMHRP